MWCGSQVKAKLSEPNIFHEVAIIISHSSWRNLGFTEYGEIVMELRMQA